jgi:hypothetical protein
VFEIRAVILLTYPNPYGIVSYTLRKQRKRHEQRNDRPD